MTLYRSTHAEIGGHLRHTDGTPVANAGLVFIRSGNSSCVTTRTNRDGHFAFESQQKGEYILGLNFPSSPDWFDGGGAGPDVQIPPASVFYPGVANRSNALIIRLATDESSMISTSLSD
jgi:hypothetical protein